MIELLKDQYKIQRKIGRGGMAQIYLAMDKDTDQEVAIKILDSSFKNDVIKRKRFQQEVRLMKQVDSPYVVRLYDANISDKNAYIVMEYVDGVILTNHVKDRTRLTVDETVEIAKQLALGCSEIHKRGIIHRDIKSQNIMITHNGAVKILDFGIAIDNETTKLTKTDMLIGSPQYVAPELIEKEEPTKKTDIYSLGILMYEMLTGTVPFNDKDALVLLRKHQVKPIPRIKTSFPNVPQSLENIIIKATAKDPKNRHATMYDMYLDLNTSLNHERISEEPISLDGKKRLSFESMINSKWTLFTILLSVFLIILAVIVALIIRG